MLSLDEVVTLAQWSRSRMLPARVVERAQIVRLAADGVPSHEIAQRLGVSRPIVQGWGERFLALRLPGLEKDTPRPGRRPRIAEAKVRAVIEATLHTTPPAAHWTTRTMAAAQGVSEATVRRIWHQHRLQPHRVKTFKLSRALKRGRCGTMTHDYKRHGTTALFAALSLLDRRVIGDCMPRHRHQEFIRFLKQIDAATPPAVDLHLIVNNYGTHQHPRVATWLQRHPRLHLHFTPTSSSWLNLVERWFRDLTTERLRRGSFASVAELIAAIAADLHNHNQNPQVFVWSAPVERILAKIAKCEEALDALH